MNCLMFNGSPRGTASNSLVMCKWLYQDGDVINHLKQVNYFNIYLNDIKLYQKIVFIYPLYVDSMPGSVKLFFEYLYENKEALKGKDFLFIVHSGFGEAIHSRILERYHQILKTKLDLNRVDTIISPGSEGVRLMPKKMNQKRKNRLTELVNSFRNDKELSSELVALTAGDEIMNKKRRSKFKFFSFFGLTNIYWNRQLKQNKAYKNRFDKPYKDDL
jgi:putative NADPH-quinone reductase